MDWSKTKTIFILTFLILDLFLGFQLIEKKNESKFDFISITSIEEQLKDLKIKYPKLPEAPKKMSYISGQMYSFTEKDLEKLAGKKLSVKPLGEKSRIEATFAKPQPLLTTDIQVTKFVEENALFGEHYRFWNGHNKEEDTIMFTQLYEGRPIFNKGTNNIGQIRFKMNEDGKFTGFSQTYLEASPQGNEQEILTAMKALYRLYENGQLNYEDDVNIIRLGYYSMIEGETQVLAPTWYIEVNHEKSYFVNAVNGLIDEQRDDDKGETTS